MRIVHFDDSVTKTNAFVAGRVQQAGDFFIKLRGEMNQTKQEYDQGVKEGLPADKLAALKKDMDIKRESLHRALDATIEHADDAIMDNLGGHQKLVLSLVNVLIASIKAADYGGKLPKIVLEFFTLVPMTKKIADTPNFETVRKRFADKGDDEAKDLAREIAVKVKKALKAAEPETATGYQGTSAASRAKAAAAKAAAAQSSTKRGREDDSSADSRTVKKVAVESGGSSLSKKLAQPKIQLQSASKVPGGARSNASILGDKSRAATKPASRQEPIASVEGGSADGRKSSGSKPEVKPPAPKMGAPPSSSALSGIASLLDSINAPRAETPPAPAKETRDSETPETDEQRTKRLRKKSRRKLRVSWKPEAELVQVKVFEKEDDENEGRDMNMIRDAADDKSEGMVLKQRADAEGEGEGDEDEDEYEPDQPWTPPTEMDFSNLDKYRRDANFVTRGGNLTFSTPEQERIAQREQRELMAIYTDINDIPPTPKSPPPQTEPRQVDAKIGTLPQEPRFEEVWARWRDEQQLSLDGALYAATQRLSAKASPPNALEAIVGRISGQAQGKGGDDVNVPLVRGPTAADQAVAWLKSEKATKWRDPKPAQTDLSRPYKYRDAGTQAIGAAVEIVARALAGKAFPATEPPAWLANDDERVREWWVAYNKASAGKDKRTEEERAKHEGAAKMQDWTAYYTQQQQAYAPYMAILQQLNGGGQPAAQQPQPQPQDSQLQAILAAMGQPAQQQAAMPSYNPNDPSYQQLLMLAQMAQQGQQPPQQPTAQQQPHGRDSNGPENDRYDDSMYDDYDPSESYHNGGGGGGGGGGGRGHRDNGKKKNKPGPSSIHKPPNAALIGTKPCTFWQQGKCARGDKCTFRHD